MTEKLIGKWTYIKTVDKGNKKIEFVYRTYPNGEKTKIVASGPEITLNKDGTYTKKFTEENSDNGNWKIISRNEVEYEMLILKDSKQGKMIQMTQKLLNKKWRQDEKGNYLDSSTDKITLLSQTEMKVEYEKEYTLIYKKLEE